MAPLLICFDAVWLSNAHSTNKKNKKKTNNKNNNYGKDENIKININTLIENSHIII